MARMSLDLSSLPVRRLDESNSTHCPICSLPLPPAQCRCTCGVVNFAAYRPTAQEAADLQGLLESIEEWSQVEPEGPAIRDVKDLPMRSIWESQGTDCGSVDFKASLKSSQSFEQVEKAMDLLPRPAPMALPPKQPQKQPTGSSLSYIAAALAALLLASIVIIRKLR